MGSRESQFIFSPKLAQPVKKNFFFIRAGQITKQQKKKNPVYQTQ